MSASLPNSPPAPKDNIDLAATHIRDILRLAIQYSNEQAAVVIYDKLSPLSVALTEAYRHCLPQAKFIDFYATEPQLVNELFKELVPSDLVVLIQSTSFRLDEFRLRVELFKLSLKVIEHPHLERMVGQEAVYYIESLAYDPDYFRGVGHNLKKLIDNASSAKIDSGNEILFFNSRFESAKLNVGDYSEMKNIGGQFPIGEVFTEAQDLEAVSGRVRIFIFGDTNFTINKPEKPITLVIDKGRVVDTIDSTPAFEQVLTNIRADEGEVWLRELGFGMNKAFTPDKTVCDIGTYERMCGIHLSLGSKHSVYKKPQFKRGETWHHVDVFAVTHKVYLDDNVVFQNGAWQV